MKRWKGIECEGRFTGQTVLFTDLLGGAVSIFEPYGHVFLTEEATSRPEQEVRNFIYDLKRLGKLITVAVYPEHLTDEMIDLCHVMLRIRPDMDSSQAIDRLKDTDTISVVFAHQYVMSVTKKNCYFSKPRDYTGDSYAI